MEIVDLFSRPSLLILVFCHCCLLPMRLGTLAMTGEDSCEDLAPDIPRQQIDSVNARRRLDRLAIRSSKRRRSPRWGERRALFAAAVFALRRHSAQRARQVIF